MAAILDARALPAGTVLHPELAIIGGGPAGISLALALAGSGHDILLLESGGLAFDAKAQSLYAGGQTGIAYTALDGGRLRFLGGSTNHWGGWCRPLDAVDFEARDWLPHSGWPFGKSELAPYYPRAQALVEAGPWIYDAADSMVTDDGPVVSLGGGGVYTSWFQFSRTRGDVLPTHFGQRYQDDIRRAQGVTALLQANVTGIRLAHDGKRVDHLDIATLTPAGTADKRITVRPKYVVLASGGMENARLLLASNDVVNAGIGNQNDLVGRFFADNPIPRDTAILVMFAGPLPAYYGNYLALPNGPVLRAAFAPKADFAREANLLGSLTTVENPVALDAAGTAAVVATAQALGVDASGAKAYSLGCGMELAPDPERRLTLSGERDALDMPRLSLTMRIADSDFEHYRRTLRELGRQLLAARTGMIRLNYSRREEWLKALDWGNHHLGTTRMSDDPKKGVVDAEGKVHGVGNLYVAGSSVFPTYGASNPTLNLVALTLRLGDHLKKVMA
ncbi:MAG TPA: GMC family oxidoreductase [Rhizomicrobium sp.]|nr:GMC family oxidoreductase [Rhizomicrobium sp.]